MVAPGESDVMSSLTVLDETPMEQRKTDKDEAVHTSAESTTPASEKGMAARKQVDTTKDIPAEESGDPEAEAEPRLNAYQRLALAVKMSNPALPSQETVLNQLKDLQVDHLKIEEEYREEWNAMKLRYLARFQPLYEKRRERLVTAPPDEAAPEPSEAITEVKSEDAVDSEATGTKMLPRFWLKAMRNHVLLEDMIQLDDEPLLAYLEDIVFSWVKPEEQTSFRLEFYFAANPYFSNRILTKTYYLERSEEDEDESVLTMTEGTTIDWAPGKNLTQHVITRRQRHKKTNQIRTITQTVVNHSFFNFFQTHQIPSAAELQKMAEADVNELEMIIEAEFEVGSVLRDKIIPRALGWYLGIEHDDDMNSVNGGDVPDFDVEEDEDEE